MSKRNAGWSEAAVLTAAVICSGTDASCLAAEYVGYVTIQGITKKIKSINFLFIKHFQIFLLPHVLQSASTLSLVFPGLKGLSALHGLSCVPSLHLWLLSSAFFVCVFEGVVHLFLLRASSISARSRPTRIWVWFCKTSSVTFNLLIQTQN